MILGFGVIFLKKVSFAPEQITIFAQKNVYKLFIKPLLLLFNPEKVHHFTLLALKIGAKTRFLKWLIRKNYEVSHPNLQRHLFGLTFKNPIGLAAGFDKTAAHFNDLATLGFGFIEVGTVTPKAQKGNPQPRLFRLPQEEAIINRMGFNNGGVAAAVQHLKNRKTDIIIGGNIGKNTNTAPEHYTDDYLAAFDALHPYVDYFVLNISCPNVGSHAKLQDKAYLISLIKAVQAHNQKNTKPLLIKIAPDLNHRQLDDIIELVSLTKIDGVIATNTSTKRTGLKTDDATLIQIGKGGLSGRPITNQSTEVIRYLAQKSNKAFPIIGLGGIHSAEDALEKIEAGADLVQVYTGLIYEGPALVKRINKAILKASL